jgi:hypothetical protein
MARQALRNPLVRWFYNIPHWDPVVGGGAPFVAMTACPWPLLQYDCASSFDMLGQKGRERK